MNIPEHRRPSAQGGSHSGAAGGQVTISRTGATRRLASLADAARAIAGASSVDDLLHVVTASAQRVIGTHQAVTSRLGNGWHESKTHVLLSDKYATYRSFDQPPQGLGVARYVTRENKPLRLAGPELATHPEWRGLRDAPGHPPLPNYLAAPLASRDGRNVGLIQLSDKVDGTDFTEDDETVLQQLAFMVSAAIEHIEVAAELERALSHLGLALDAGRMGTWRWDYSSGRVSWSATLESIYGLEPGTFPGTFEAYAERVHPEDLPRALEAIAAARESGARFDYSYRIRTPDGTVRWIEGAGLPVRDADGRTTSMTGVCVDVTERHRAEERLRREHRVVRTLHSVGQAVTAQLDLSEVLQAVTDAATAITGAQVGAFFYNHPAGDSDSPAPGADDTALGADDTASEDIDAAGSYRLYALSGAPREAFAHFPKPRATDIFGPTFRGESVVRLDDVTEDPRYGHNLPYSGMPEGHVPVASYLAVPVVLASGEVAGGLFFGHPDRGVFDEDAESLAVGIAAYAAIAIENARLYDEAQRELAARQVALEELGRAEARYRTLVNSLEAVVWSTDANLQFTFVSNKAEQLFGYPITRWAEQGFWKGLIHPDDREQAVAFCLDQTRRGLDHEFEFRVVTSDGHVRWLLEIATVDRDETGEVCGLHGLMIDVTRRKMAENREAAQLAVARILASARPEPPVFTDILRSAAQPLGWHVAELWVRDGDRLACAHQWVDDMAPASVPGFAAASREFRAAPGEGLPGSVWQAGRPLWLEHFGSDVPFVRRATAESEGLRSGLAVPVSVGGEFFGVIACFSFDRRPRDDEMLETMRTIGTQIGQSLGRMQADALLEATMASLRRRSAQLRRLTQAASRINAMGSVDEVLTLVTEEARAVVGARQAAAWCGEASTLWGYALPLRLTRAELERHPIREAAQRSVPDAAQVRGLLAVPLTAPAGAHLGVLHLSDRHDGDFTDDDEALVVQLAEVASAAIHRTRLHEERARVADALQRPLHPPEMPRIPGLDIAARYQPYGEVLSVGGDFYDVFETPHDVWVAALGDVCGKGPDAAALTGLVRQTIWTAAQHSADPVDILRLLNTAILRTSSDRFCSVVLAMVDPRGHGTTVRLASAGHPPPLHVRGHGSVRTVNGDGSLLGLFPDVDVSATTLSLSAQDTLLLYTDGLTEGGGAEPFDGEHLTGALAEMSGWEAQHVVDGLVDRVRQLRTEQRDDLALLVLRAE